jgi:hypothetical protein
VDPTQGSDRHDLGRRGGVGSVLCRCSRHCRPAAPSGDRPGATGRPAAAVGGRRTARAAPLVVGARVPDVHDGPAGAVAGGRGGGAARTPARVGSGDDRRAGRGAGAVGPVAVRAQQCPGHAVAATGGRLAGARARDRGGRGGHHGSRAGGRRGGARAAGVRGDLHRPGRCDGGPGRRPRSPAAAAAARAGADRPGGRRRRRCISPSCWPAACGSPWRPRGGWAPAGSHPTSAPPPLSCSRPGSGWRSAPTGRSPRSRSCSCWHLCSCWHHSPSSSSRRSRRGGPAGRSARACRPPSGPWPPSSRSPSLFATMSIHQTLAGWLAALPEPVVRHPAAALPGPGLAPDPPRRAGTGRGLDRGGRPRASRSR